MKEEHLQLQGVVQSNYPLARHTSWKIGGAAEYFYRPVDVQDFSRLVQAYQAERITVLGAATNVLIRDAGINGLVIYLRDGLNTMSIIEDGRIRVEAGVGLMSLVRKCVEFGAVDIACLAGIPGTVGGALKMNAGAYGNNIWNHVVAVETIDRSGRVKLRKSDEFIALYRHIDGLVTDEFFVAAHLSLTAGDPLAAKQQMVLCLQKRKNSQPLSFPSCGSVFRNPQGGYAAQLIETSGLKGRMVGGARVSEKHANFIVNCGNATAADVESLMQEVINTVEKVHGVKLLPEVCILGGDF